MWVVIHDDKLHFCFLNLHLPIVGGDVFTVSIFDVLDEVKLVFKGVQRCLFVLVFARFLNQFKFLHLLLGFLSPKYLLEGFVNLSIQRS